MVRTFIKTGRGGGQRPFINFIKKTDVLVQDVVPYLSNSLTLQNTPPLGTEGVEPGCEGTNPQGMMVKFVRAVKLRAVCCSGPKNTKWRQYY